MKIELTEKEIKVLAVQIGASAATIIANRVAQLEERELIVHLNASIPNERQKVLTYLENTKRGVLPAFGDDKYEFVTAENRYLREHFHIPPLRMKALRDALESAGTLEVREHSHRPMTIRYRRLLKSAQ